jgi:hypothetical protein
MHYSGFLSNFSGTTGSSGGNTDILSTVTQSDDGTIDGVTYSACYFTIGQILVQFTDLTGTHIGNVSGQAGKTITFPKSFSGDPWCIVVSPSSGAQNSSQLTLRTDSFTTSQFNVYFNGGTPGTGLTYIAIGPGPPI